MRTFLVGIAAIVGSAIGNAQTFDFHALTVSGHSRYAASTDSLKESLQKEGSRAPIASTLPATIHSAVDSTTADAVQPQPVPHQGPPVGAVIVGAACVLVATAGGFRHLMRRQAAMRPI